MTFEQKYYDKMTPNEWLQYKLNSETMCIFRRERRPALDHSFNRFMRDGFVWAFTPQGHDFWFQISLR